MLDLNLTLISAGLPRDQHHASLAIIANRFALEVSSFPTRFWSEKENRVMINGFSYHPAFLSSDEQTTLLADLATLQFRRDTFRGIPMRRTIVCYGSDFDAQRHSARNPAPPIPAYLAPIRDRAAVVAGVDAGALTQAIIWRYPAKVGIGWHVDNSAYGPVICGLSLAAPAVMKLKREAVRRRFELAPGSLYILRDEARYDWMHTVDGNPEERYSITFRSMR